MYLLAKSSLPEKGQMLIVCAASCTIPFNSLHIQVYPHTLSVLLFSPILYFCFERFEKPRWQFRLLFIIFLILLPYTHPSGSVTLIFLLLVMELVRIAYAKRCNINYSLSKISVNPILISFMTFFAWISSFTIFGAKFSSLWSSIFDLYNTPHLRATLDVASRLELIELVEYNLKMYGDNLIYIMLALIAGVIIIKKILNREKGAKYLLMLFVFFVMCIPIEYILFVGVRSETMGRVLNLSYMMIVAPVLVSFVLYELFKNKQGMLRITVVVIILTLTFGIGVLSIYHSPWIFSPSWHITNRDVKGSTWFLEHRNSMIEFDTKGIDASQMKGTVELIPEHFNYSFHETLGESLQEDGYVAINKRCKLANANPITAKARLDIWGGWGFTKDDFNKLERDSSVARIYSNGEFDTFLVSSNTEKVR